ncbi:MAG: gas vesicle protein GvpK [Sulfitobacter sp.]
MNSADALTPEQEERLGLTLMRAENARSGMLPKFGLFADDLSHDLGPLGQMI